MRRAGCGLFTKVLTGKTKVLSVFPKVLTVFSKVLSVFPACGDRRPGVAPGGREGEDGRGLAARAKAEDGGKRKVPVAGRQPELLFIFLPDFRRFFLS